MIKYYIEDESPSEISEELFKTNNMRVWTRGYIQRLKEKAGSHRVAAVAASLVFDNMHLMSQYIKNKTGVKVCPICGTMYDRLSQHIRYNHMDIVQSIVNEVLAGIKSDG